MNYNLEDLPGEVWKDIAGYEGIYQVSNLGRVKSLERQEDFFNPHVGYVVTRPRRARILKSKVDRKGYLVYHLRNEAEDNESWPPLHKLVAMAFISNPEEKPTVNHINGIKTDNRIENLEWATMKEQTIHAYALGLATSKIKEQARSGEENPSAKLTWDMVAAIRKDREEHGMTLTAIAEKYGMGTSSIHRVCTYKTWVKQDGS